MASFGDRIVGAMRLDAATFEDVERDPTAMGQSVGVIVIAAVAAGIGRMFVFGLGGLVTGVLTSLIGYAVWSALVFVIGTKVMPDPATKADFAETFRVLGFAAAPGIFGVLTFLPLGLGWVIGFAVSVWTLIVMVVAVKQVLDYTSIAKAAVVCIVTFIACLVIWAVLLIPFGLMRMLTM